MTEIKNLTDLAARLDREVPSHGHRKVKVLATRSPRDVREVEGFYFDSSEDCFLLVLEDQAQ